MKKKLKIWWAHRVFNFKYPVKRTEQVKWLIAYGEYIKQLEKIRKL